MADKYVLRNLEWNFPQLFREADEIRDYGPLEVLILKNGERPIVYDDLNKFCRTLPRDACMMSENECRNEFGIRMRKRMQIKGINQFELADRSGISQGTISNYANGTRTPNIYNAIKIADVLGCSIEELMYTGLEE